MELEITALDTQLNEIDKRLQRLYNALDDLALRIKALRSKQDLVVLAKSEARETFDAGRVEHVRREVALDYLRGVRDLGTGGQKRIFLRSFIESVEVKDSQVTVRYTLPLPAEQ